MTPEEAKAAFLAERDKLTKIDQPVPRGGPGEALVGDEHPGAVVTQTPPDLSQPPGQDIPGMALAVGSGEVGERVAGNAAAARLATSSVPAKYKVPLILGARMLGGGAAAFATDLGYQELRRSIGDVQGPDNFEQSLAISAKTGSDQMMAGAWAGLAASTADKLAWKTKADPERLKLLGDVQESFKRVYERIGGKPLVEDMRGRWNPMRILKPLETELSDTAVVQNLKNAGLDPAMARKTVLQGGMTSADLLDNAPYNIMQAVAEGSFSSKKYMQKYHGTRSRLYELWADDLAGEFASALPEEKLGQSVAGAVNGNFNFPNAVMTNGMNSVKAMVKPDFVVNMQGVKTYFKNQGILPGSTVGQMVYDQPNATSFDAVVKLRQNVSSLMHAQDTDPAVRAEAMKVAKTLDNSVAKQLPFEVQDHYRIAAQADDVLNEGQFRTRFIKKMLGTSEGYRQYGKYLLKNGDVGNFTKLEAAVGKGEADKVRRGISEIVLQNAVREDGSVNPASLHQALNEHGKYGRYFLEATLGPQWIKGVDTMQRSMETLQEAAKDRTLSAMSLGSLKTASVAPILWDFYHGSIDKETAMNAALLYTAPKFMAKILTSPKATANIERLTKMAVTGQNPRTFTRLVARTAEAAGISPEALAAAGSVPGITEVQQLRKNLGEGRLPLSTGSKTADAVLNPAGAIRDLATGQSLDESSQ